MFGTIYKITNKINNKFYIGKTKGSLSQRMACHKSVSSRNNTNQIIHKAIRKYGWSNFKVEILKDNIKNLKILNKKEIFYIKLYNSTDPNVGYNLTSGGDGGIGLFGNKNPNFGKKRPELSKRNSSNRGKTWEELYGKEKANRMKINISFSAKNRVVSEDKKKKQSEIMKSKWKSGIYSKPETSAKFGKHAIGVPSVNRKEVYCHELMMKFESVISAAKYTKNTPGNVCSVLKGNLKQTKGYTFSYMEKKNVL